MIRPRIGLAAAILGLSVASVAPAPRAVGQEPASPTKPGAPDLYKSTPGPWEVKIIDEEWRDEARQRTIPVRLYIPQPKEGSPAPEKHPVIVFSHGLGGSGKNYAYFGRHMAGHGYIVVAPTHPGSDTAQALEWMRSKGNLKPIPGDAPHPSPAPEPKPESSPAPRRAPVASAPPAPASSPAPSSPPAPVGPDDGAGMIPGMTRPGGWLMSSVNDPDNLRNRPRDISFVLDRMATHPTLGPIADMTKVGVAGHSFGAYTAMAAGGMRVDLPPSHGGPGQSFRDPRVLAVLPMSPEGSGAMGIMPGAWDDFATPVLFLTGTRDYGVGARSARWRREGFEGVKGVDHALVTIAEAGHMTFANPTERTAQRAALSLGVNLLFLGQHNPKQQARHVELIESLSSMFFDAYLRGDGAARDALRVFTMTKRDDRVAEFRPAEPQHEPQRDEPRTK